MVQPPLPLSPRGEDGGGGANYKKLLYIYSYTYILSVFLIENLNGNEEEENS